jgi:hypothetical protein
MLDRFRQKLAISKNYRLKWLFLSYVLIIIIFAWLYQKIYQEDNTTFVFATEVYQTQIAHQNQSDSNYIQKLESERYYIDSVKKLILLNHKSPDSIFISNGLANTKTFRFKNRQNFY